MARTEEDKIVEETRKYTLTKHRDQLRSYQLLSDAFQEELYESEILNNQLTSGRVNALRLDDNGKPLFKVLYSEIDERIGWLQLSHPESGDKLVHVQTRLQGEDKGKVADSTTWEDGVYQGHGHIQANVTPLALVFLPVEGEIKEDSRRKDALDFFTKSLRKPGKWQKIVPPHK